MPLIRSDCRLTDDAVLLLITAARQAAEQMGVPQCIAVVDQGCHLLGFLRMDGARVLSIRSATRKAMTAATTGAPSGALPGDKAQALAAATDGEMTGLPGGLPVRADGQVIGGIGIGSGKGEEDLTVALAAVAAFEAALSEAGV